MNPGFRGLTRIDVYLVVARNFYPPSPAPGKAHTPPMNTAPDPFETPDCPVCLMPLDIAGSDRHLHFVCPTCDLAFLSTARDRLTLANHTALVSRISGWHSA